MKKDRTANLIKISGILLEVIALTCIVICIVQEETHWFLPAALLCNALSFLLYFLLNRKKK